MKSLRVSRATVLHFGLCLLMCAVMGMFVAVVTASAANNPAYTSSFGQSFVAETTYDAVSIDAVASGPGDTVYVGGRWRPADGSPDFVGIVRFGVSGEYRGRFGDYYLGFPYWDTFSPREVTGVAYDSRRDVVWVSGSWGSYEAGSFSGAVAYSSAGVYLMQATGGLGKYFPARSIQDVSVDGNDSTVYLAGWWLWWAGGPATRGVIAMTPTGQYLNLIGSVDTSPPAEERDWDTAQTQGVAWAPNGLVYAGGTWVAGGLPCWIGSLGFSPGGPWVRDLANAIPVGDLNAISVADVDADTRSNALVAATWSGTQSSVVTVGRFTELGTYLDSFGTVIERGGRAYTASAIGAVGSDRDLAPEFDAVTSPTAYQGVPLTFSVSAHDVYQYYVAGRWVSAGQPSFDGIAVFTENGDASALTYSAGDLPAGATFDAATRTLSWTPTKAQVGDHTIVFRASDGSHEVDMRLSITVLPVNTAPVANAVTVSALEETPVFVTLNATDIDGDALTYEILEQPAHGALTGTAPNLTYTGDLNFFGADSIVYRARDHDAWSASATVDISVENVDDPPVVTTEVQALSVAEGQVASLTGSWSDPDSEPVTISAEPYGQVTVDADGTWTWEWLASDGPEASSIITLNFADECGEDTFRRFFTVNVDPLPPALSNLTCPVEPVAVGTRVSASGDFADPGTLCPHSGTIDWGDGTSSPVEVTEAAGVGHFTGTHTYTRSGVFSVSVNCADDDGQGTSSFIGYVVSYDPNGGFVTGGGWIESPTGAYTPGVTDDPDPEGIAHFAFEAKYLKGASTPIGHTSFRFQAATFEFASESYQWLVVAGTKAQFKGVGAVNGTGNYGFMLTAVDEGTKALDRFRMKIWDVATGDIVYDNQYEVADIDPPTCQIAGGSIIVRTR